MTNTFKCAMRAMAAAILFAGMPGMAASNEANGDLACSDESLSDYNRISVLAGRMIVGPALDGGTPEQHRVIHENFHDLSLEDGKTYFVVAHKPTGELFTSDCAEETCSFDEVTEPNAQCEMMHYRGGGMDMKACMFFAVRFQGENFCLQQPATAQ